MGWTNDLKDLFQRSLVILCDALFQTAPSEGSADLGQTTGTRRQSPLAQLSLRKFLWFDCFCAVGALIFRGSVIRPPPPPTNPELMTEVWTLYSDSATPYCRGALPIYVSERPEQ